MRTIAQSISALVLGFSSLALGSTAQADSAITLVYSTDNPVVYPYTAGHRYYPRHSLSRAPVCAVPYRGHSYRHRHDYHDRGHSHYKQPRWIDRHGYHHRDAETHRGKNRYGYGHDDRKTRDRNSQRGEHRSGTRTAYDSHGSRY